MATGKKAGKLAPTSAEQVKASLAMFEPKSFEELLKFAEVVSKSGMVPKDYVDKPAAIVVAVIHGRELGLQPLQSLQTISNINGRPAAWGDGMLALVQGSGLLEDFEEKYESGKDSDDYSAVCRAERKGIKTPFIRRFSIKDAKRAGLWGRVSKSGEPMPWSSFPQRMLQMRARSWALRDGFADVLKGLRCREEEEDLVNVEAVVKPAVRTREDVEAEAAGLLERPLPPMPEAPDEERAAIQGEAKTGPVVAPPAPAKAAPEGKLF